MNKLTYFLAMIGMTLTCISGTCQTDASTAVRATNTMMRMTQNTGGFSPSDMIQMMPPTHEHKVDGNPYWDEHWGASSVLLYDNPKLYEGWLTRYDINRDEFEFNLKGQIKVAQGKVIKNVVWVDSLTQQPRLLVNAKEYRLDSVTLTGFVEILVEGDQQLVKRVELHVLKPNYNVAMSTGSKNSRISKEDAFYYSVGNELYEIKYRKNLEPLFGELSEEMMSFIKKERLRTNREADLVKIFKHYATLRTPGGK